MSNDEKLLAIVIELQGDMLYSALAAWSELRVKLCLDFISSVSPAPHITLESNLNNEHKQLSTIVNDIAINVPEFTIQGNGVGVFIEDTPVIHVRWSMNNDLFLLKKILSKKLQQKGMLLPANENAAHYNWLPKTTLAYKDSSYENLSEILRIIRAIDFKKEMNVSELSIYEYSYGYKEKKLETVFLRKS